MSSAVARICNANQTKQKKADSVTPWRGAKFGKAFSPLGKEESDRAARSVPKQQFLWNGL
jgi:hypothetical protein